MVSIGRALYSSVVRSTPPIFHMDAAFGVPLGGSRIELRRLGIVRLFQICGVRYFCSTRCWVPSHVEKPGFDNVQRKIHPGGHVHTLVEKNCVPAEKRGGARTVGLYVCQCMSSRR
ncbi:hypothetical protein D8B26_004244 [Coccidioides posadasii str. Silveira]|uniref:uncharacterized protein n=1 Tax=Coccidioides posadasii (strain RMSCC 757 / Silveira) TaxID=443226 RepID=UPI001BEECBA5|nr:hypothetical protein D8B26_004244 [Coccidioides posadasii str. Silveira]